MLPSDQAPVPLAPLESVDQLAVTPSQFPVAVAPPLAPGVEPLVSQYKLAARRVGAAPARAQAAARRRQALARIPVPQVMHASPRWRCDVSPPSLPPPPRRSSSPSRPAPAHCLCDQ